MDNIISLETRRPVIATPAHASNEIYNGRYATTAGLYGRTAVQVDAQESLESAMHRAGMLFTANKTLEQWTHDGQIVTGDEYILKRSDTGAKLGNVTNRYKQVQPSEVVEGWQKIVGTEGWNLKTLGSIDGGKRIWALAETDRQFTVGDSQTGDTVSTQLLLSTSFDGKSSTIAKFMTMRLVCLNGMILPNVDGQVKIGHNSDFNIDQVARELRIAANIHGQAEEDAQRMAAQNISNEQAATLIMQVLDPKGYESGDMSTKQKNLIADVLKLYGGGGYGSTMDSAKGTVWGAMNAITEHCDHNVGRNDNNRIREAYFGKTAKIKQNAYNLALELCA